MKINNIEMQIIPSPHQIYARSGDEIIPVKEYIPQKKFLPFDKGETIRIIEQNTGQDNMTRRYLLKEPDSDSIYMLPVNTPFAIANHIESFDTGHAIFGFNSPSICARKYYSVDISSN